MIEILLPRTDAGVYAQAVAAVVVYSVALVLVRHDRDFRVFVAGLATITAAWMGLRAVH